MTIKRVRFIQELLKFMGLEGRLHLEWISSAEAQKFVQVVTEFTEKMKSLGPSPLSLFNKRTAMPRPGRQSCYAAENKSWAPVAPVGKKQAEMA